MNIVVKPVKCGDCSMLCGKSEKLLIDCGSDNSGGGLCSSKYAFSAIQGEINNKEITGIMVSHFDKDHFNGFLEIPSTYHVETVYLPYSIIDGKVIYSEGLGRLLSIAPSGSWGFQLSKNILNLFRKLEQISTNIRFIKKDDTIPFEDNNIRVLWPEVDTTGFKFGDLPVKQTSANRTDFISFTSDENGELTNSLTNIESDLAGQFEKIVGVDNKDLLGAMRNFIGSYELYIRYLHENRDENRGENFAPVDVAYRNLNIQRELFRSKLDDHNLNMIKDFSLQQYHSLIACMNAISIVCDCKDRFIFFGDVPANIIDYISSSFENQYIFVKVQHHGTRKYFTNNTPCGDYKSISNGGYERRKVYEDFIGHETVICTNAHNDPERFCSYFVEKGVCAQKCIKVGSGYQISV